MIKIYTITTYPWCIKVKNYLNAENVEFQQLNVQDDMKSREEIITNFNQMSVPVLDIDNIIIIGFNKTAILKALGK